MDDRGIPRPASHHAEILRLLLRITRGTGSPFGGGGYGDSSRPTRVGARHAVPLRFDAPPWHTCHWWANAYTPTRRPDSSPAAQNDIWARSPFGEWRWGDFRTVGARLPRPGARAPRPYTTRGRCRSCVPAFVPSARSAVSALPATRALSRRSCRRSCGRGGCSRCVSRGRQPCTCRRW